ncbi:MAG TPA: nucleotide exchange factor GrpE [Lachnospiraceae bacterium]|nr:nucleotide exchange factor GrpE [Lachnospiraceae bacterium]
MADQKKKQQKQETPNNEQVAEETADMTQNETEQTLEEAADTSTEESADADVAKAQEEESEDKTSSEENAKESKFFGKKKDKEKEKLKEQADELNDRLMRQMAEFENYRKRTEKEKQAMFETGAKSVIEKLLPTVDNFERGLAAIPEEEAGSKFVEGMQMIYKQLMAELEKLEVKPIEAIGKEFDPNLHNAVMHIDDENFGENIVAQELQKGYTYRDSVVRHSMVQVAN